jgi:hypothetical protein
MKNKLILKELENYFSHNILNEKKYTKTLIDKYGTNTFTYGSTPYNTFKTLYDKLKSKPNRFIVVGCSIGWMNFYWNDLNPDIETIGIDIHDYRLDFGKDIINKYDLKNISLSNESFETFEFKEGDLVWESNLCFPNDLNNKCNNDLINKISDISIISYKHINDMEKFNKIKLNLPVSWKKDQTFYIYERK